MFWNRIVFLSIVAALGVISASLCAPALPFIGDHFSAGLSSIQFTISLFLVGNACGQFLSGPLSDQLGQRRVLLSGLLLYILASCGCALSEQMSALLICRMFQGMGSAVGPVLARAIASNLFPADRSAQVQSYGAMGVGFASILAILSSGQITLISWRGNFWLAAGLGALLLLWTRLALKKSEESEKKKISFKQIFTQMGQVFKHPIFLGNTFAHAMTYGLMYGYIALFPFFLLEIFQKKDPVQVGIYSAYMIGCYMLGAFFASRAVVKWGVARMMSIGLMLQLISGILLIAAPSTFFFFAALFLFNLSIGIILPVTSAGALAPFAGRAVGSASSSLGLSYRLIGSILSTVICQFSLSGGKSLGAAILLLSIASLAVGKWTSSLSKQASARTL
ncbi:MAG: MFS transporter [Chlamydiales bacterium]|nr:MFS transporter [Chlamydiales bacterium]